MANGLFAGGNGSMNNPYLIEDAFDLDAIRKNVTASYKLIKSIDLTPILSDTDATGWIPIPAFRGVLDGNGHTIRNLFINRNGADQGLFNSLRGGRVYSLGLVNAYVSGGTQNNIGLIAGRMLTLECLIENCFVMGTLIGTSYVGGIVGKCDNGKVINSFSEADITVTGTRVGGIVGSLDGGYAEIRNSYFAGRVTGGTSERGGIAGEFLNSAKMTNCFFDATRSSLTGEGSRTTAQMQSPSTFATWASEFHNFKNKTWVFKSGVYPRLFFTESTKYCIFVDGKYKTFRNQEWVDVSTEFPTESAFENHGITDYELSTIPRIKWNELRGFGKFDLVASTDKYIVERKVVRRELEKVNQISDAIVLKTTLNFDELGDSVNRIRILQ